MKRYIYISLKKYAIMIYFNCVLEVDMLYYIKIILIMGLIISLSGYFFVIMREKYYLKNNIIIIDNKSVRPKDFEDIDMKQMSYKGIKLKTGDELKIKMKNKTYKGTLIGGKFKEGVLKIITSSDEILELKVKNILDLKLTREYGKFFTC